MPELIPAAPLSPEWHAGRRGGVTATDRRESDRRYNASPKGHARNRRYEEKHPERRQRWEPARNAGHARRGDGIR